MPGEHITQKQVNRYMKLRNKGNNQAAAALKSGFSERTGRRIEKNGFHAKLPRQYRTRPDPLEGLFEQTVIPMLEATPDLQPITIFEQLEEAYPSVISESMQRTLQRRIKKWRSLNGPEQEVMFQQKHRPGQMGICDYTILKNAEITIDGKPFIHRLFHYRLVYSKSCSVLPVQGGESFESLTTGLLKAFQDTGGVPIQLRTDSLSAAFKNKPNKSELTERYHQFCHQMGFEPCRNNPGVAHENGAIEAAHGHLKRRIVEQLKLRGSYDFATIDDYQTFLDQIANKLNSQHALKIKAEQRVLKPVPKVTPMIWREEIVTVSSQSTISLLRVLYTVPSRLIGRQLLAYVYTDKIQLFCDSTLTYTLNRLYASQDEPKYQIDYRHLIHSLVKKPNAFKGARFRDEMIPQGDWQLIWRQLTVHGITDDACRKMVKLLHLAAKEDCEKQLGKFVLEQLETNQCLNLYACQKRFERKPAHPEIKTKQHDLKHYNQLLGGVYA